MILRRKRKTGQTVKVGYDEVTLPLWIGLLDANGREASWPGYRRHPVPTLVRGIFDKRWRNLGDLSWQDIGEDFHIAGFGIFDSEDSPRVRMVVEVWANPTCRGDSFTTPPGDMELAGLGVARLFAEEGIEP